MERMLTCELGVSAIILNTYNRPYFGMALDYRVTWSLRDAYLRL